MSSRGTSVGHWEALRERGRGRWQGRGEKESEASGGKGRGRLAREDCEEKAREHVPRRKYPNTAFVLPCFPWLRSQPFSPQVDSKRVRALPPAPLRERPRVLPTRSAQSLLHSLPHFSRSENDLELGRMRSTAQHGTHDPLAESPQLSSAHQICVFPSFQEKHTLRGGKAAAAAGVELCVWVARFFCCEGR